MTDVIVRANLFRISKSTPRIPQGYESLFAISSGREAIKNQEQSLV
jgi:hypothetical protein